MNNERGFVLVLALMMSLVMTLIMAAMMQSTTMEAKIAGNNLLKHQTAWLAEGGIEIAKGKLKQAVSVNAFRNLDGLTSPQSMGDGTVTLSVIQYDDVKNYVRVRSDATLREGRQSIEALLFRLSPDAPAAIYSETKLKIQGDTQINGGTKPGISTSLPEYVDGKPSVEVKGTAATIIGVGMSPSIKYDQTNFTLADYMQAYRPYAKPVSGSSWGSSADPAIVYSVGDTNIGGITGYGILLVEGNLTVHGGLDWTGLIIVSKTVTFLGGGSDHVNIHGGIMSGEDCNIGTETSTFGGSMTVTYQSFKDDMLKNFSIVSMKSWREVH